MSLIDVPWGLREENETTLRAIKSNIPLGFFMLLYFILLYFISHSICTSLLITYQMAHNYFYFFFLAVDPVVLQREALCQEWQVQFPQVLQPLFQPKLMWSLILGSLLLRNQGLKKRLTLEEKVST